MTKAWIASFFIIILLHNIPVVSVSANNLASLSASQERIKLDFEENDCSKLQEGGYASIPEYEATRKLASDVKTEIKRSASNRWILSDPHLVNPGISTITILSDKRGYDVQVDGRYVDTEGKNEPLDGRILIRVEGDTYHTIRIYKESWSNSTSRLYFEAGRWYPIIL